MEQKLIQKVKEVLCKNKPEQYYTVNADARFTTLRVRASQNHNPWLSLHFDRNDKEVSVNGTGAFQLKDDVYSYQLFEELLTVILQETSW